MAFDPSSIPVPLIEAYRDRRCGLLVGAGASAAADLPLWGDFLRRMIKKAKEIGQMSDAKAQEYENLIGKQRYLMAASGLKDDLGPAFADFIREVFIAPKPAPTALHEAITSLDQLKFVLTTNYDNLIEKAYRAAGDGDVTVCTFKDAGEVRRSLSAREFFILKAHGDAGKSGEGIILTEQDYRNILFKEPAYQHMLASMFSMYTVIFVGASMTDPELNLMLNYLSSTFQPDSGPIHYAALTTEETTDVEHQRWFKDFKIKVIPVSSANEHSELTEFLMGLKDKGSAGP